VYWESLPPGLHPALGEGGRSKESIEFNFTFDYSLKQTG
jgi:hypothetical protein